MKCKISLVVALIGFACGGGEESGSLKKTSLNLGLQFPGIMALQEVQDLKSKIEYYRFEFSGQFQSPLVFEIEQKKFQEYSFKDIPFDSNLHILVQALSSDRQTIFCTAETSTPFSEGFDRVITLEMRCP